MVFDENPKATVDAHPAPAVSASEVYERYRQRVCWFYRRRGFTMEESEDLAQETFLRVSQKLHLLRSEEALRSWVLQVAANIGKNELRHRSAKKREASETSLDDQEAGEPLPPGGGDPPRTPESDALSKERLAIVQRALARMGPQRRHCLLLYARDGFLYREIAQLLQISIQTVKSHIHQARSRLLEDLDRSHEGFS